MSATLVVGDWRSKVSEFKDGARRELDPAVVAPRVYLATLDPRAIRGAAVPEETGK